MKSISLKRVGPIISVRFFDRMVDRQTRQLSAMLQRSIAEAGGRVRLLLVIESEIYGRSPESLFESLQFLKLHADRIDRIAIVGRKSWERTYLGLFSLFSGIEIDYFDRADAADAVRWSLDGRRAAGQAAIDAGGKAGDPEAEGRTQKPRRRWFW